MHPGMATSIFKDECDRVTKEITTPSTLPTYDPNYLTVESGEFQLPQSITSQGLNSPSLGLDEPVYDYFPATTQSLGSSNNSYGFQTPSEQDWSGPSYLAEATSSAPYMPFALLLGPGSVSLHGWAVESCSDSYDLFAPITDRTVASVPVSELSSSSKAVIDEPSFQATAQSPNSHSGIAPELVGFPVPALMSKPRPAPVSSGMVGSGEPDLAVEGERPGNSGHKPQLRTAPRKAKSTCRPSHSSTSSEKKTAQEDEDHDNLLTAEERRARQSHNIVEKKYRNRLNEQFVRLLAALPANQQGGDAWACKSGPGGSGDDAAAVDSPAAEEKRLSKAEVLDLATKRIKSLEEKSLRLQQENSALVHSVDAMTSVVVNRGLGKTGS